MSGDAWRPKAGFYIAYRLDADRMRVLNHLDRGQAAFALYTRNADGAWERASDMNRPCWYPTWQHAFDDFGAIRPRYVDHDRLLVIDCATFEPADVDITV